MLALSAHAAIDAELLKPLAGDDPDARIEAVSKIAALASEDAFKVLNALKNDSLYATPDGKVYVVEDGKAFDPSTGTSGDTPDGVDGITVNNRLRGAVEGALSGFKYGNGIEHSMTQNARQLPSNSRDV